MAESAVLRPEVEAELRAATLRLDAQDAAGAVRILDELADRSLTPHERGAALRLRGVAAFELGERELAISLWGQALTEAELTPERRLNLLFNLGMAELTVMDYRAAIDGIEAWIEAGGRATDAVHLSLVAAYVELGEMENALDHGRQAFALAAPPQKRHYDTLNYLYTELGMTADRERLRQDAAAAGISLYERR